MLPSEGPSEGALDEALHVNIAPELVDVALLAIVISVAVHLLGDDLLAAHRARVVLLADPAIKANRMEDVLRVALQSNNLVLLLEVFKTDAACDFTFVLNGVEVFASKGL